MLFIPTVYVIGTLREKDAICVLSIANSKESAVLIMIEQLFKPYTTSFQYTQTFVAIRMDKFNEITPDADRFTLEDLEWNDVEKILQNVNNAELKQRAERYFEDLMIRKQCQAKLLSRNSLATGP